MGMGSRVEMGSRVGMGSQVGSYLGISGSGILHLVSLFKAEDPRWDVILHELKSPQQGNCLGCVSTRSTSDLIEPLK